MLCLHYHELIGKIEKYKGKKYLMTDDYTLDKLFDKIKMIIGIEKFDDAKILINTNDKLFDEISLKGVVVLILCVIKDEGKCYPQILLEALVAQKISNIGTFQKLL